MTKSELQKVLNSLSSIQDRILTIEKKFDDKEDYEFDVTYSEDNTLRSLISVASCALDQIFDYSGFRSCNCLYKENDLY